MLYLMTREKEKTALVQKKLRLVIEQLRFGLFIEVENMFQVEELQCNKRTYLYGIVMLLPGRLEKTESFI
jgi:hypothetical protein